MNSGLVGLHEEMENLGVCPPILAVAMTMAAWWMAAWWTAAQLGRKSLAQLGRTSPANLGRKTAAQ
jgi:hypothetical protein